MRAPVMAALGVLLAAVPGAARAQLSTWSTDARTGCRVWNPAPLPNETVTWSGACRNGVGQGAGVLLWIENGRLGDRYDGELRDGKQTGRGVITAADGKSYDGSFRDGTMNGHGIYTYANGDHYDGEWRNGKPNGIGRFVSAINGTIEGNWTNGCLTKGDRHAAVAVAPSSCH